MDTNKQIREVYHELTSEAASPQDHHWIYTFDVDFVLEYYGDSVVYVECIDTGQSELLDLSNITESRFVRIIRDWSDTVARGQKYH